MEREREREREKERERDEKMKTAAVCEGKTLHQINLHFTKKTRISRNWIRLFAPKNNGIIST